MRSVLHSMSTAAIVTSRHPRKCMSIRERNKDCGREGQDISQQCHALFVPSVLQCAAANTAPADSPILSLVHNALEDATP